MSVFIWVMEEKIMFVVGKIVGQWYFSVLCDGIILIMLLIIIGFVFLILMSLLIFGYVDFMMSVFGKEWVDKFGYFVNVLFDIMVMIVVFGIVYCFVESYGVDVLFVGVILIVVFLLVMLFEVLFMLDGLMEFILVGGGILIILFGSKGLFVVMLIVLFLIEMYWYII